MPSIAVRFAHVTAASLSLLLGAAALLCHALAVPVVLRAAPRAAPVMVHVGSAAIVHLLQILAGILLSQSLGVQLSYWHGAAVFGAGVVGYLFLFSAVYKSISLRMLALLVRGQAGPVSVDALTDAIVRPEFGQRVDILVEGGLVEKSDDGFCVTSVGRVMAGRLTGLQHALGVAQSGLY